MNVFCLPFAGGSKHSYLSFIRNAPPSLRMIPLELPGRGSRIEEPLRTDIHELVDDLWVQLAHQLDQPYAIFGHSMGSLLGFLLTRRALAAGKVAPAHLLFTGAKPPSVPRGQAGHYWHQLSHEEFKAKIISLGGMPDEILEDPELLEFFEPILRADFQAVETYQYEPDAPFDIPLTVVVGKEESISLEEARKWGNETVASLDVRQYPGKHFFIYDHEEVLMRLLWNKLRMQALIV